MISGIADESGNLYQADLKDPLGKIHGRLLAGTENVPVSGVSREDPPT
jgi:hypothetical protein